jgi:hypothetical protein
VTVVVCTLQHMEEVRVDPHEEPERLQTLETVLESSFAEALLERYARTLFHEERVMACFGVCPMWLGVARAWAMISQEARQRCPKTLYSEVKRHLAIVEERDDLTRIEATVRYGHPSAHSWIRHLGFEREGLMRNYGMGGIGHHHLYARTRACPQG